MYSPNNLEFFLVKMEVADDTMEVIDFGSDTEPDTVMSVPTESGTNTVALQQPHSSNGKFGFLCKNR